MHVAELHHVGGRPLLNGMFAVSKRETAVGADGVPFEVCRLIMKLVPTNSCCRSLIEDISTLPTVAGMSSVMLDDNQLLITSSEDIRCFLLPISYSNCLWAFNNSVAIAQHMHRRVISQVLRGERALATGHQEIRRDRGPSTSGHLYRVYLDNYDEPQKVDRRLADAPWLSGRPTRPWGCPGTPRKP